MLSDPVVWAVAATGAVLFARFLRSLWRGSFTAAAGSFAWLLCLTGVIGIALFAPRGAKNGPHKIATEDSRRLSSSKEFVWIRENQRILSKRLKDPDSARFSDDRVSYRSGAPVVCGTVQAKNSFGGYNAPERYIGGGTTIGVFMESEVSDFDRLWSLTCF